MGRLRVRLSFLDAVPLLCEGLWSEVALSDPQASRSYCISTPALSPMDRSADRRPPVEGQAAAASDTGGLIVGVDCIAAAVVVPQTSSEPKRGGHAPAEIFGAPQARRLFLAVATR